MKRYLLTDEAQQNLIEIREYLKREAGLNAARSTLKKVREACVFLSGRPGAGHSREDLTTEAVKFWSVFSYLIIYDPATRPLEILRVIHGNREVSAILAQDQ